MRSACAKLTSAVRKLSTRVLMSAPDGRYSKPSAPTIASVSVSMGGVLSDVWHLWLGVSGLITRRAAYIGAAIPFCPDRVLMRETGGLA